MSSTQLSFTLSTSTKVKTAHLLGSWDNYSGQLPLSKDSSKAGKWKGTFRFGSSTLKPGSRYWYYYIIDGYHVSHDPSTASTKEPTTGRLLNILDVPKSSSSTTSSKRSSAAKEVPKGRSLSPSKIVCPKPSKPYASRAVREADYSCSPSMDDITEKLEKASMYNVRNISPPSSVGSSLSSRSSDRSSPASLSSLSDPSSSSSSSKCSCNRYGVTRRGDRVKLDCGGSRCGYSDDSESCSSIEDSESSASESESESESEDERPVRRGPSKVQQSSKSKPRYVEVKPKEKVSSGRRR